MYRINSAFGLFVNEHVGVVARRPARLVLITVVAGFEKAIKHQIHHPHHTQQRHSEKHLK